jgi:hypothetical protein
MVKSQTKSSKDYEIDNNITQQEASCLRHIRTRKNFKLIDKLNMNINKRTLTTFNTNLEMGPELKLL